ncbi:hypothetical protein RN001_002287 [Aquatica leii]|uniref:Cilia- and flagella-associated protein 263 n=1 Tax=Aquatica leii TaxID=1421715 RepID=A0AAN7PM76_9COLE|nr:hypothetical protein RN001_002287 [Aquatica leii]
MTEATNPQLEVTPPVPLTPTAPPDEISRYLDEFEDAELVKLVEDLATELRHLDVENQVFEHFLQKNEPSLLTGMIQILELAGKVQVHSQSHSTLMLTASDRRDTTDSLRATSSRKTDSVVRFTTTASTSDRGPRINLSQKMDLSMREMEEMQIALDEFIQKSHRAKSNLKAKLEELVVRESEVKDARSIFEQTIVTEGVDSLTGKIPAEKFLRYMDEWLRSAESTIGKMRLRTSTLKALFLKLCTQLVQKEELGETIDAADFDQLRIENKHLEDKIEQKTFHLLELKKMNGAANLVLTTNRKYLLKQVHAIKKMKNLIKLKEQKIIDLDKECEVVEKQVQKESEKYNKTFALTLNYTVPETLEYIKNKTKLDELKKQMKIWERKNSVQQFELKTCIRKMKNLTGIPTAQLSWFQFSEKDSSGSISSFE